MIIIFKLYTTMLCGRITKVKSEKQQTQLQHDGGTETWQDKSPDLILGV